MRVNCLFFCLIVLSCGACAQTVVWEKTGSGPQTFDLDSRECGIIASRISLLQSETGEKADPVLYGKALNECLAAKGWNKRIAPPEAPKETASGTDTQLAEAISANTVAGLGQTITVPDSYTLLLDKQFQSGTTVIKQFFWQGEDSSFINILFQNNLTEIFKQIPYPVLEPYKLYTNGKGETSKERLQWGTFWGQIGPDWVMGTGAYYYVSKKERIIVVITRPLVQPSGPAPEKTTLTQNQYLQIDQFSGQWQLWLNRQFQEGPGMFNQLKKILNPDV